MIDNVQTIDFQTGNEIQNCSDLIPGEYYFLVDKHNSKSVLLEKLIDHECFHFTTNRIWACENNPQAFERWDIFGPIKFNKI